MTLKYKEFNSPIALNMDAYNGSSGSGRIYINKTAINVGSNPTASTKQFQQGFFYKNVQYKVVVTDWERPVHGFESNTAIKIKFPCGR